MRLEIRDDHIKFPKTLSEVIASVETFTDLTGLPIVVGAVDGSHVRMKAPIDSAQDHFSRYQQHGFVIQAVVNGKKYVLNFICGFPGSMHDGCILRPVYTLRFVGPICRPDSVGARIGRVF